MAEYVKKVQIIKAIKFDGKNLNQVLEMCEGHYESFSVVGGEYFFNLKGHNTGPIFFKVGQMILIDAGKIEIMDVEKFNENHTQLHPPDWIGEQSIRIPDLWKKSPDWPTYPNTGTTAGGCPVCGMKFSGAMGYVCQSTACPTKVTCGNDGSTCLK